MEHANRVAVFAFFAQDTWKATSSLTVNYGMRYEYYPIPVSDHFGMVRYDPTTQSTITDANGTHLVGNILLGGLGGLPASTGINNHHGMLVPRVGISYRLNPKTVIRSGFGLTVDPDNFRSNLPSYPQTISSVVNGANSFIAAGTVAAGIPALTIPDTSSGRLPLPQWGALALISLATAAHQAWSANLFTLVADMFPEGAVASIVGIGASGGFFAMMFFGPRLHPASGTHPCKGGYGRVTPLETRKRMNTKRSLTAAIICVGSLCIAGFLQAAPRRAHAPAGAGANWSTIGGTPGNSHYSALRQINTTNVSQLKEAWRFDTGEPGGLETTPLIINGVLYAFTPSQKAIALDAATGRLLWTFESGVKGTQPDRGMTFWTDGKERRLFCPVMNFIYALDPADGKPIRSFGKQGRIDLREGLGRDPESQSIALTTPGVLYKDLLLVGGRNPETIPAPPGDIRAFDAHTGALRWSFHTIPHPGEFGYETWPQNAWTYEGAANNWAGMAIDGEHGIVYVPTGSAVPDFYGGGRAGNNLFANTLLALDANTGKRLWHFQGVHHDLWDRDFPSAPVLLTIRKNGKDIPAIGQTTKQGFLYLFNRLTGDPVFPIQERPTLGSTTPGEVAAATQPFPTLPAPFAPQTVTEDTLTNRTPESHAWAVKRLHEMRNEGQFVPLSVGSDTLVSPSFEGGAEWGGPAVDESGILYVNANAYASIGALAASMGGSPGRKTYLAQCSVCHGESRQGSAEFPRLLGITKRLTTEQITTTLHEGKGRMPAMPVRGTALTDLLAYLRTDNDLPMAKIASEEQATSSPGRKAQEASPQGNDAKFNMTGYRRFNDPDGYPATATPWGTLSAIDTRSGNYLWQVPLGEYPELAAKGMKDTGSENYGGPVVTAGGLIFIAATNFDHKIRAFEKRTGKVVWEATLPFAGNATPSVYEVNGREFVVIAAGGSSMNPRGPVGGVYVAFALP